MKQKRSGYSRKNDQGKKEMPPTPQSAVTDADGQKNHKEKCSSGICEITWKPASVAR